MRCFKHPKEEAVGMCKVCNKGLCEACAVEKDDFLFCKQHAEMPEVVEKAEEEALAGMRPKAARAQAAPLPRAPPKPFVPRVQLRIRARSTALPAIVGGIISGVLMGFPFVNIPCMLWMVLGGAAASYFLIINQDSIEHVSGRITKANGAEVGAVSGLVGASIAMVISLFMAVNFADLIASGMANISDRSTAGIIAQMVTTDPNLNLASLLVKYVVMLTAFPIFGAIGGYLVARFIR